MKEIIMGVDLPVRSYPIPGVEWGEDAQIKISIDWRQERYRFEQWQLGKEATQQDDEIDAFVGALAVINRYRDDEVYYQDLLFLDADAPCGIPGMDRHYSPECAQGESPNGEATLRVIDDQIKLKCNTPLFDIGVLAEIQSMTPILATYWSEMTHP